jgi:hypothetical protein
MNKHVFEDNLAVLGLPDRAAFTAMIELTPDTIPYKEEMLEVLESIDAKELADFIDAPHPTDLAIAFKNLRTD